MDSILQTLMDLAGVNAALLMDPAGRLAAWRAAPVYDQGLCQEAGASLVKAIDSLQLQHEGWETVSATFADGRLLLRGVPFEGGAWVLAVVADGSLNPSFAGVALRVAANKVKRQLEGRQGSSVNLASSVDLGSTARPSASMPPAPPPPPVHLAQSGVAWARSAVGSSVGITGIGAADPAAAAFLSRCTKELARSVGPMSKVYVQEAVRRIAPDATFALPLRQQLVDDLAGQIEDDADRKQFLKAVAAS